MQTEKFTAAPTVQRSPARPSQRAACPSAWNSVKQLLFLLPPPISINYACLLQKRIAIESINSSIKVFSLPVFLLFQRYQKSRHPTKYSDNLSQSQLIFTFRRCLRYPISWRSEKVSPSKHTLRRVDQITFLVIANKSKNIISLPFGKWGLALSTA